MEMGDTSLTVALFDSFPIRRTWHDGRWFYSIVDCMAPLSGSPHPSRYWSELKDELREQGFQLFATIEKLPLPIQNGKMYKTDCADTETMLRIVQSVKSPNAEPFKMWLAQAGTAALATEAAGDTELRSRYRHKLGTIDDMLHQLVSFRGVVTAEQHRAFTDSNYQGMYENCSESDLRDMRELIPGDDIRDWMGDEELAANIFQRAQTKALIERRDIRGAHAVNEAAYDVGVEVRLTIERLGGTMPEDLPKHKRLSKGDYVSELQTTTDTVLASGTIYIAVRDGRAVVSMVGRGAATNWEQLEIEALIVVHEQGGTTNSSGYHTCPQDIAAAAQFGGSV